jgi:glycerol-1-phosphate dehydrogenase [NAD(P)+]
MARLPGLLDKLGLSGRPLAVYDNNTYGAAGGRVEQYLPGVDKLILQEEPGDTVHPDERQMEAVAQSAPGHTVLLAVGSGVINDIVRYVAFQQDIPFVSVPTAASVDGFVANCAAVSLKGAKATLPAVAPLAVVADLDIIAAAPARLTASGVGDVLSKYLSATDWLIEVLMDGSYYCPLIAKLSFDAADMAVRHIDSIARRETEGLRVLMKGLLVAGIAIQMAEITRPASSFEHHFSHYFEVVPTDNPSIVRALHGEKVGVASIIAAKYFPVFARLLKRIFEEEIPNRFDMDRVAGYYSRFPAGVIEFVKKENTPTISLALKPELLKKNYDEILRVADSVPSPDRFREIIKKVGGHTDYREIDITPDQFRETMKICCYIRNRFTLLRIICDYRLFDFDSMDD